MSPDSTRRRLSGRYHDSHASPTVGQGASAECSRRIAARRSWASLLVPLTTSLHLR